MRNRDAGDSLKRRLLATTLPVVSPAHATTNAAATIETKPAPSPEEIMAACKQLLGEPRPRWAGGGMPGIRIEASPTMPNGWFGLREPGQPAAYAGPLPLASFGIFYRGGDVVVLSPENAGRLALAAQETPHGR